MSGRPVRAPPRIATPMISDSTPIATSREERSRRRQHGPPDRSPPAGRWNRSTPGPRSPRTARRATEGAPAGRCTGRLPERDPRRGGEVESSPTARSELLAQTPAPPRPRAAGPAGGGGSTAARAPRAWRGSARQPEDRRLVARPGHRRGSSPGSASGPCRSEQLAQPPERRCCRPTRRRRPARHRRSGSGR